MEKKKTIKVSQRFARPGTAATGSSVLDLPWLPLPQVIGAGFGRTGTNSLKVALEMVRRASNAGAACTMYRGCDGLLVSRVASCFGGSWASTPATT